MFAGQGIFSWQGQLPAFVLRCCMDLVLYGGGAGRRRNVGYGNVPMRQRIVCSQGSSAGEGGADGTSAVLRPERSDLDGMRRQAIFISCGNNAASVPEGEQHGAHGSRCHHIDL